MSYPQSLIKTVISALYYTCFTNSCTYSEQQACCSCSFTSSKAVDEPFHRMTLYYVSVICISVDLLSVNLLVNNSKYGYNEILKCNTSDGMLRNGQHSVTEWK